MASIMEEGKYLVNHSTEDEYEHVSKTQMYDFDYPMAGMFLWLRANFEGHTLFKTCGGPKLARALWVFMTTENYRVLVAPGTIFSPNDEIKEEKGWSYYRMCFAAVDEEVIKSSSKGFVRAFVDFWAIEDEKTIDKLLAEDEETLDQRITGLMTDQPSYAVNPIVC